MSPSDRKPSSSTVIGLLLFSVFAAGILTAGLCTQSWVKRLDQPPAGTYRVAAKDQSSFFLKLSQKSIKGLHHTNGIRGQIDVPGEATPRPLAVRDTTSTEWENKIKLPQFLSGTPSLDKIETNVVLLLETRIPADPALIGKTLPVTFFLDMTLPRVDPQNLKAGMEAPLKDSWTVQVLIMPPGYARIYQRAGTISLIVAGGALALILVRLATGEKKPTASPAPASV